MPKNGADTLPLAQTRSRRASAPPSRVAGSSFDLARLRLSIKPFRLHWFPTLGSTNDHAAALRRRGALYAPAMVLTGRQTAGRGRGTHAWWSGGGCLTVTFVLPVSDEVAPHQVPLLAGLAMRRAAAALVGSVAEVQLKWPNDLLVNGRKLAGLLCERMAGVDLIGVGLNVNLDPAQAPEDLRDRLTSLAALQGRPLDMTSTLAAMASALREVFHRLPELPFPALLREYDQHHALPNQRVTVIEPGGGPAIVGVCQGLDSMGRLLVRDQSTLHHVIAGQVLSPTRVRS